MKKLLIFFLFVTSISASNGNYTALNNREQFIVGLILLERGSKSLTPDEQRFFLQELLRISGYSIDEARNALKSFENDPNGWFEDVEDLYEIVKKRPDEETKARSLGMKKKAEMLRQKKEMDKKEHDLPKPVKSTNKEEE